MFPSEEKNSLPPLRNDLKLLPGPPQENGSPTWTLHDPVCNRFYRIGWLEFELLARWHMEDSNKIIRDILQKTLLRVTPEDIGTFFYFLSAHSLLQPITEPLLNQLKKRITRPRERFSLWLLKHYLFIRIPLVSPDRFLELTLPVIRLFFTRTFLYLLGCTMFFSFILIIRQWDTFIHTFLYFFSVRGILWYALAIFISKLVHEMGHAYASKYYGINIPTMGIAFLVLYPMLYTDNSEAWKLKNRVSRMMIVAAGTLSEWVMAVLATLVWSFLPDGPLRSACFVLATVTWISSLFMNLCPFMRFDGYYLLSDFLDIPNLQDRSFALGKWYLRNLLLGLSVPCPEKFPEKRRKFLILFAYATWIYRLILFTTIALMVYHLFFKTLGLFLFAVEIGWFVILPIYQELRVWWKARESLGCNGNIMVSLLLLILFLFFLIYPWKTAVYIPAILKPEIYSRIYSPYSGCIRQMPVKNGDRVHQGDLLFELHDPHLEFKERETEMLVNILKSSLNVKSVPMIQKQLAGALTQLQGIRARKKQLRITAPSDGILTDISPGLRPGIWIGKKQELAILADPHNIIIKGYLTEENLANIHPGDSARYYMETGDTRVIRCTVREIAPTASRRLNEPYLASIYGGDIPVSAKPGVQGSPVLVSHKSLFQMILIPEPFPDFSYHLQDHMIRGTVRINGKPQSLIYQAWLRVVAVVIRESGF